MVRAFWQTKETETSLLAFHSVEPNRCYKFRYQKKIYYVIKKNKKNNNLKSLLAPCLFGSPCEFANELETVDVL